MVGYIRAGAIGGLWGLVLGFLVGASVTALIHILLGAFLHGSPISTIPDSTPLKFQFTFSWDVAALSSLFWGGLFGCINILSGIIVGCLLLRRRQKKMESGLWLTKTRARMTEH